MHKKADAHNRIGFFCIKKGSIPITWNVPRRKAGCRVSSRYGVLFQNERSYFVMLTRAFPRVLKLIPS